MWFKEIGIRHSFTLESTFFGRERTDDDPPDTDLHMHVPDFKLVGEDLGRWFINFLPVAKYQRKINFLYRKFLKIIHEEALKWCLPFNQDRYLKKNYTKEAPQITESVLKPEELGPSLEELEGKPIPIENDESSSSSDSDSDDFETPQRKIFSKEHTIEKEDKEHNPKMSEKSESDFHEDTDNFENEEAFSEFNDLINCVEEFEHHKAMESSDESYCDDSDSDDDETNLVQKQFTKLRNTKPAKKQTK